MPTRLRRAMARTLTCPRPRVALLAPLALALCAPLVTGAVGPSPGPAAAAASAASPAGTAIRWGLGHLGAPYRYGGTGPSGYDCSGFTRAAYAAAGVTLPHSSREQYAVGRRVDRGSWQPGDLVFWSGNGTATGIYHVGIYLGPGRVLHQTEPGDVARIAPIFRPSHVLRYAVRPGGRDAAAFFPVGPSGDTVRDVQLRLRANGHPVKVSGVLDGATVAALRRFQDRLGLTGDGALTWATWVQLVRNGERARPS